LVECQFNELLWLIFISGRNIFRFFYKPLFFLRNSGLQRGNETKSGIAAVPGTGLWRLAPCQPVCHEQTMICDFLRENARRAIACSDALIPVRLKKRPRNDLLFRGPRSCRAVCIASQLRRLCAVSEDRDLYVKMLTLSLQCAGAWRRLQHLLCRFRRRYMRMPDARGLPAAAVKPTRSNPRNDPRESTGTA
jgi:hypothetical protein